MTEEGLVASTQIFAFLDFDGVTHPWQEVEDFRCLPIFEEVVREFDELRVVITSDWRTLYSLPKLRARFSEDIRSRIVGTTPLILPKGGGNMYGLREREARQWLLQHSANDIHWLAIDDAPGNWPTRSRLLLTDFKRGFTVEDAERMRRMVVAMREGRWHGEGHGDSDPNGFWNWPVFTDGAA